MNSDRIVIRRTDKNLGYYTVEADGKVSTFLCWGEMIEQLISLTHSDIKYHRYHARTVKEEEVEDQRRLDSFHVPTSDAPSPLPPEVPQTEDTIAAPPPSDPYPDAKPAPVSCCDLPYGHEGKCLLIPF